ncbi:hypothetical protein phytr_7420 [Candidatus Phycorickettsia trachydisci]|uniref:Uncharacterized protein n=1 Tax=Candidatus Phycorickettsia trachydisci TaxID=2115978 RepID=A0A2P1P8T1_9RICK|nr:hypothetical protein [Candidatus Phycorickettsia trachydisci]AVP87680.1 hypothetical protein phytr_7420 [Candidatus Phycorickettsia trachydisci]
MTKEDGNKHWKFKASGDYYKDLAMRESSNQPNKKNKLGYKGLYQMGDAALIDTGYISRDTKQWTGKHGMDCEEDFLHNRVVQNIAIREYHKIVWGYLKSHHQYEGQVIKGIKLTKAGMISAAHLVGSDRLKQFIDTQGQEDKDDGNKIKCSQYLQDFSGYDIDYSIDGLIEELKTQQDQLKKLEENFSQIFLEPLKACPEQFFAKLLKDYTANRFLALINKYAKAADKALEEKVAELKIKTQKDMEDISQSCQAEFDAAKAAMIAQGQAEAHAVFEQRKAQAQGELIGCGESLSIHITNADFVAQKNAEIRAALDALKSQLEAKMAATQQEKEQETQELITKYIKDNKTAKQDTLEKCNSLLKECLAKVELEAQKGSQADLNKANENIEENLENFAQLLGLGGDEVSEASI